MKSASVALALSLLALPAELVSAVRLDLHPVTRRSPSLDRRGAIVGSASVDDSSNIQYAVNITLGGSDFSVIIDTGSSDLYVSGTIPNTQNTGKSAGVQYAIGQVEGPVQLANLDFLGFSVPNQAFINQPVSENFQAGTGLIGLGPSSGSQVLSTINNSTGDPPLERIFLQDTSTPNYMTVLLGRVANAGEDVVGQITIGEALTEYSNITSQPQLPITSVPNDDTGNQHWQTLLDANGVIGPTGQPINIQSGVSGTSNKNQLTVVFDTGFSLPQVPASVAEAFYRSVPGAQLVNQDQLGQIWQMGCDYEVNITFKFGGLSYPVNPVDAVLDLNATDDAGNKICYGAFQPISQSAENSVYDMIFGMAFLRNIYLLINFGDFLGGSTNNRATPYAQMLSTSNDTAQVHNDFVSLRGSAQWTPSYDGVSSGDDSSTGSDVKSWISSHLPLVIGVSVSAGLILLGLIVACCCGARKRRAGVPAMSFMGRGQRYQPLHDPAPQGYDMNVVGQGGRAGYNNPWDAHY